jgi:hypothetical protein
MKLKMEELEDILTIGEMLSIKNGERFNVDLILERPDSTPGEEDDEIISKLGFRLSFRPYPEEVREGISTEWTMMDESEIEILMDVIKNGEHAPFTFPTSFAEQVDPEERSQFESSEFYIKYKDKIYKDKTEFEDAIGINELMTVSFKIPAVIFAKFKKIAIAKSGTFSHRIRDLIEDDVTEEIRLMAKREAFK